MQTPKKFNATAVLLTTVLILGGLIHINRAGAGPPSTANSLTLAPGTWINGKPTTLGAQKGKVVVLTFWAFQCINCKRTLPFWNRWAKRYRKKGQGDVVVLSVHTPELASERDLANVRAAVHREGLHFPVVTDNHFTTWKRFKVEMWPTTILLDKEGYEAGRWVGELNYDESGAYREVEAAIEHLRKE